MTTQHKQCYQRVYSRYDNDARCMLNGKYEHHGITYCWRHDLELRKIKGST